MWERKELKERGKVVFKRYYWKAVLVSFIAFMLTGGMGQVANNVSDARDTYNEIQSEDYSDYYEDEYLDDYDDEYSGSEDSGTGIIESLFSDGLVLLFVNVFIIVLILSLLIKLFIAYPLTIGKNNYFMGIREEEKPVKTLLFVYKSGKLKSSIFTMFMMELFTYLWSLLFVIPGIVKSYEYRMIPYILSENPTISRKRAFEISKQMMNGNKWETFVLDLSFLGWYLLSICTLGLLSIFYVNPYVESTNAELYAYLREDALKNGYADQNELIGF